MKKATHRKRKVDYVCMKNITLCYFLLTSLLASGIILSPSAYAKNQLTRIKGTNISLIPPSGFSETSKFSGFWKTGHVALINVREVDMGYEKTLASLASFRDSTEKIHIKDCAPQQLGMLCNASLVASNSYSATKLYYVFPANKNRTVMVEGIVGDREYKQTLDQVRAAILTAVYAGSTDANPFDGSDYIVDRLAPFQFVHKVDQGFVFTKGEQFFSGKLDVVFVLFRSFTALDENIVKQAEEELHSLYAYQHIDIQSQQAIQINGTKAYEILARGETKVKGEARLIYQVLVPTRTSYYILRGVLDADNEKYLPVVKQMAASFHKKG